MNLQTFRNATHTYHQSAAVIHQISTNLWVQKCEKIVMPKSTLANNVKVMIGIHQMLPDLFKTQVLSYKN